MLDFISSTLNWIVPPPDADHAANLGWRWRIAIFTALSFFGVVIMALLAFGVLPIFSGFASADSLQASISEQRQHWVYEIDKQILDYRIDECHAATAEAKQLYFSKLQYLTEEYFRMTKQQYVLPPCGDI
jgi:hypothetical protein